MPGAEPDGWRLNRTYSISLIVGLLAQAAAGVWFASKMDSRVTTLELRYVELAETTLQNYAFQIDQRVRIWDRVNAQGEGLNAFRAELAGANARLDYIGRAIDRLTLLSDQRRQDAKPSK
jgi:hypothetical protein